MRVCGLIVATALLIASDPVSAIDCQTRKGEGNPWAWREIDGKKCWYKGRAGIDKRKLRWATKAKAQAEPKQKAKSKRERRESRNRRRAYVPEDQPIRMVPVSVAPPPAPAPEPGLTFEQRWCATCIRGDWWVQPLKHLGP
jgi:hypothetical protein